MPLNRPLGKRLHVSATPRPHRVNELGPSRGDDRPGNREVVEDRDRVPEPHGELLGNDLTDGDGIELVIGILLDTVLPFDEQTIPPTTFALKLGEIGVLAGAMSGSSDCNDDGDLNVADPISLPAEQIVVLFLEEKLDGPGHPRPGQRL